MDDLFAEILERPDDDAPRLVLADALTAAGDPRGELIVVQCALARLGAWSGGLFRDWIRDGLATADIAALRTREAKLLRQHGDAWTRDVAPFVVQRGVGLRRGFVEFIRWDAARHLRDGLGPVLDAAPLVRAVSLATEPAEPLAKLYASPALRRIRELHVGDADGLSTARLALTRLDLNHGGGPHQLRRLVDTSWWPHLTALTLSNHGLDATDIRALVRASPRLTELQLISSRTGRAGAELLAPLAPRLEILSLRHAKLVAGDVAAIFTSWPRLAALDLRTNTLDTRDIAALAKLPALRVLAIANTKLDTAASRALMRSPLHDRLRVLDVG